VSFRGSRSEGDGADAEDAPMSQFARMKVERRFFGLDVGDWPMLLGGSALVGLVAFLV
jgi:hypothetical protein